MTPPPRIAVCPGTYDPITNGHLDIITRAASTFDEVVVAVVHRPHRKGTTLFDIDERLEFIHAATADLPNVSVQTFRTLYLMASPKYSFLSSSGVKELSAFGGNVDGLVAPRVAQRLQEELGQPRT